MITNNMKKQAQKRAIKALKKFFPGSGGSVQPPKPQPHNIRPQYTIRCFLNDFELSNKIDNITIVNSIKSVYPIFFIECSVDINSIITEKIYGQDVINLQIMCTDFNLGIVEDNSLELIAIKIDIKNTAKAESSELNNKDENKLKIIAIPTAPFLLMTSPANYVLEPLEKDSGINVQKAKLLLNRLILNPPFSGSINNVLNKLQQNPFSEGFKNLQNLTSNITDGIDNVLDRVDDALGGVNDIFSNLQELPFGNDILPINNISVDSLSGPIKEKYNSILSSVGTDNISKLNLPQIMDHVTKAQSAMNTAFNIYNSAPVSIGNFNIEMNPKKKGRRPFDIACQIFKQMGLSEISIKAVDKNCIEDEMEQVLIPPKTFCGAIRYIDDKYGIFKGRMFHYCRWEDNTYCLWDLGTAIEMPEDYTVEFLVRGKDSKMDKQKENTFYTYNTLHVNNSGNEKVIKNGNEQVFIKKNLYKFFEVIKTSVDEIAEDNGVSESKNKEIIFSDMLQKRKTVFSKDLTGGPKESSNDILKNKIAKSNASGSSFSFRLRGPSMQLKLINRVGGCIRLNPHSPEQIPYQGKYIVASSIMHIYRGYNSNYECETEIQCFRQNLES